MSTTTYTFGNGPLHPNAVGYTKPQPKVIDLTDDAPAVKQEPAPPLPAPVAADDEDLYTCPISMEYMVDPVMADDGHMYDLEYLLKWFATTGATTVKSPKTNEPMTKGCVRPWAFHKAYAAWASASGHPAPVASGPYGRVVVVTPALAPVPAPAPRVTGAAMMGVAPAPAPRVTGGVRVVALPVRHALPSGFGGIVEVPMNCLDAPNIQLRMPAYLAGTTVPVQTLSDRFSRWSQDDARAILKANFPNITIRTNHDLKGALKALIRSTPPGSDLWNMVRVSRWMHVTGDLRFSMSLSVEQYIHIRGPTTTVPEVLKRLTLPMLKNVASRHAPQLVPSMSTKARAVQVLAAHFIPLCTPVPAQ